LAQLFQDFGYNFGMPFADLPVDFDKTVVDLRVIADEPIRRNETTETVAEG